MGVRRRNEKEELRAAMWVQGNFFIARSASVRATFFLCAYFILKTKSSGATRACSLCFILSRKLTERESSRLRVARRNAHAKRGLLGADE